MQPKRSSPTGFTLIELLVVISIISLLFSITLASLQTARRKGQAAKTIQDLKQTELALRFSADDLGRDTWWLTSDTGNNPFHNYTVPISDLVASTTFPLRKYYSAPPLPLPGTSAKYFYRNASPYACNTDPRGNYSGVTLHIESPNSGDDSKMLDFAKLLDLMIDGKDDKNCGRLIYTVRPLSMSIYYVLGKDSRDF